MKSKLWLFLVVITFFSCFNKTKPVIVDNPTKNDILIVLDSKDTIKLSANEKKEIPIKYGKRKISVNGEDLGEIELKNKNNYILNPTRSNYYGKDILYFSSKRAEEEYKRYSKNDTIIVGGTVFKGRFKKYLGDLLIVNDFDYGLDEQPEDFMAFTGGRSKITRLDKLYREKDLLNMFTSAFAKLIKDASLKVKYDFDLANDSIVVVGKYVFDFSHQTLILDSDKTQLSEDESVILYQLAKNLNHFIDLGDFAMHYKGEDRRYSGLRVKKIIERLKKYLSKDKRIKFEEKNIPRADLYYKFNEPYFKLTVKE